MKRIIKSATNSVSIPMRTNIIEAADDEVEITLQDKIKDVESDFDYILSGLDQLDEDSADTIINQIEKILQGFIQDIADQLIA